MTNIQDKRGNVIISSGLKVRHKSSQFEYTVDSVKKDSAGTIFVLLKDPEAPRFKNQRQQQKMRQIPKGSKYNADSIPDFSASYYTPDEEKDDDLIAVEQDEFEKEYEVK